MPNFKFPPISTDLLLSLGTAPLLLALIGSKALAEMVQTVGQVSEEVFRGDRLPILKISLSADPTSSPLLDPEIDTRPE